MNRLFIFFFSLAILQPESLISGTVNFRNLGIKEGLSQMTVYSVYQDETGALWFGTRLGINRYDGNSIEHIPILPTPPHFVNHVIWEISGDQNGHLFILADKTILQYDLHKQTFEVLVDKGVDVMHYRHEKLYYIIDNRLFLWNSQTREGRLIAEFDQRFSPVRQMLYLPGNGCFLAGRFGLLHVGEDGELLHDFLEGSNVSSVFFDSKGRLWAGTKNDGVFLVNLSAGIAVPAAIPLRMNDVRCFTEDLSGNIWMGTFNGIIRYNPERGEKDHFLPVENLPFTLSHASVYSLMRDKQGTIWAGTYYGGVNYFNPEKDVFTFYNSGQGPTQLSYPIIGNMAEDGVGNLWICTEGGGLNCLNRLTGDIKRFSHNEKPGSLSHNNLKSILFDQKRNKIYLGTHMGGLSVLDLATLVFTTYRHVPGNPHTLPNDVIGGMAMYEGKLYIATQGGLAVFDPEKQQISSFEPNNLKGENPFGMIFNCILIDSKGRMWLSQFANTLYKYDFHKNFLERYAYIPSDSLSYSRFRITRMIEDSRGRIFMTTEGSGLMQYDEKSGKFIHYMAETNQLLSNFCFNLAEAPSGRLIITSNKGITFFDVDRNQSRHLLVQKGFPLTGLMEENGLLVTSDGQIFVAGIDGMISFNEKSIEPIVTDYALYFSKLYINNRQVIPGGKDGVLKEALPFARSVRLRHNQSNLVVEFASSNYVPHLQNDIEYMLEGFDREWIRASDHSITYTNIPPGKYRLRIREVITDPALTDHQAELGITVMPPWYSSPWAYTMYFVLISGIVVGILLFYRSRAMLKASLAFERKEKERIEELNQSKLRFFTNIAHEFRTPITLILAQIELLFQHPALTPALHSKVKKIQKHALRMKNLVNELIDFRKQEQGQFRLKVSNNNLIDFLADIFGAFQDYAVSQQIKFSFEYADPKIEAWFDSVQMQKVFYNLLSNAFKFTRRGDSIVLSVLRSTSSVIVKVTDTGVGIPVNDLKRIFDRFYQAENIASDPTFVMSSGIGLALTKNIIELHGGKISVESVEGQGSVFKVELPLGDEHFTPEQKYQQPYDDVNRIVNFHMLSQEITGDIFPEAEPDKKPVMLIAEDDEDLMVALKELFRPFYLVETAVNGEEAYNKVLEYMPDIVLSDIMMPRVSGRELCRRIKSNYELSHIPVVLLTAQVSTEQIASGYQLGADDYITKPFDPRSLIIRCNNLVKGRKLLREKFSKALGDEEQLIGVSESDKELIHKMTSIIESRLDSSDFNINDLALEMGMGRSKLYALVKEITGMTPNAYILNYKMRKAVYWLKNEPRLSVSEIAYRLGFNNPKYFTVCFKDHFGVAPSVFRKSEGNNEKTTNSEG
ncbi:MAG: response regulator [Bacteroidales bacterium]|nr:response regulator [Bacteroidales bacterium]